MSYTSRWTSGTSTPGCCLVMATLSSMVLLIAFTIYGQSLSGDSMKPDLRIELQVLMIHGYTRTDTRHDECIMKRFQSFQDVDVNTCVSWMVSASFEIPKWSGGEVGRRLCLAVTLLHILYSCVAAQPCSRIGRPRNQSFSFLPPIITRYPFAFMSPSFDFAPDRPPNIDEILSGLDRYNPGTTIVFQDYVSQQCEDRTYDCYANLALLKL